MIFFGRKKKWPLNCRNPWLLRRGKYHVSFSSQPLLPPTNGNSHASRKRWALRSFSICRLGFPSSHSFLAEVSKVKPNPRGVNDWQESQNHLFLCYCYTMTFKITSIQGISQDTTWTILGWFLFQHSHSTLRSHIPWIPRFPTMCSTKIHWIFDSLQPRKLLIQPMVTWWWMLGGSFSYPWQSPWEGDRFSESLGLLN